jgi:hypothetical protein
VGASDEIGTRVDRRLAELYKRHRQVELPADARCYVSGQGYRAVETSAGPDDAFAITLAGLDGSLASVGDDDDAFALQSVSKVFASSSSKNYQSTIRKRQGTRCGDRGAGSWMPGAAGERRRAPARRASHVAPGAARRCPEPAACSLTLT